VVLLFGIVEVGFGLRKPSVTRYAEKLTADIDEKIALLYLEISQLCS
jgi:hypothetical protein